MADPLIEALLQRYSRPSEDALGLSGDLRRPDLLNALAQPSIADVMAQYRAPQWGGLRSYLPDQPEWMKVAQGYAGQGLGALNKLAGSMPPGVGDVVLAGLMGPRAPRFTPVLRLGDELFTGNAHVDAYHKLVAKHGERVASGNNVEEGFLGPAGEFLTRHEAQAALNRDGTSIGLTSSNLYE